MSAVLRIAADVTSTFDACIAPHNHTRVLCVCVLAGSCSITRTREQPADTDTRVGKHVRMKNMLRYHVLLLLQAVITSDIVAEVNEHL